VLKDRRSLKTWGSEIGSLGRSTERLEIFQNTGLGNWKFGKSAEGLEVFKKKGALKLEILDKC
jgi:hypothetical protein